MHAFIIRTDVINAGALPGGYLHVNMGIIRFAESPEELAFIIGHELGHVAHRHGLRRILHGLGLVYFMAMATGDIFTASGVILAAHTALNNRNSRAHERQADAYGVRLLTKLGVDTHAGADFWDRLSRQPAKSKDPKKGGRPKALISFTHPHNAERAAAIRATPRPPNPKPLLSAEEWQALRQVCG
jgi:predicted Zn-dependent protease